MAAESCKAPIHTNSRAQDGGQNSDAQLCTSTRHVCPRDGRRASGSRALQRSLEGPSSQQTQAEPGSVLLDCPRTCGIWGLVRNANSGSAPGLAKSAICRGLPCLVQQHSSALVPVGPQPATPGLGVAPKGRLSPPPQPSKSCVVAFAKAPTLHHNSRPLLFGLGCSRRFLLMELVPQCQPLHTPADSGLSLEPYA